MILGVKRSSRVSVAERGDTVALRRRLADRIRRRDMLEDAEPDILAFYAFPDHAAAMRNSEHPVTADFAKRMHEVTEGETSFRNLDVAEILRM